jgi:flagellar hook-associated protein 3 FlgL
MVTRVTTPGNYSAVLTNLLAAQRRQQEAGDRVATQRNGKDLKDYAKNSEILTAMKSVQSRLGVYQEQNDAISDKLATQNTGITRVADAAQEIRQIMAEALASGRADTLVEDIQAQMNNAVEGLNGRYGGKYLFAGGQVDTRPVTAQTLADLTSGPPIASFFKNDQFKVQAKLDEATNVTTGVLADEIGTGMLTQLQTFQAFNQGASGPFTGAMTAAQRTFLEGQLQAWETIRLDVTNVAAHNGTNQTRLDTVASDLVTRQNSLAGMVGDITDADMAEAYSQVEQANLSVQASAYVLKSLQESSLLNLLR